MNELLRANPEFILASIYAVAAGAKEVAKARHGIDSKQSVCAGVVAILIAGGLFKSIILKHVEGPVVSEKEDTDDSI